MSIVVKAIIYIIVNLIIFDVAAQQCTRPESAYLLLGPEKSDSVSYYKTGTTTIYFTLTINDIKDTFLQVDSGTKISPEFYKKINFFTPSSLRKKELEILKCEIEKGEKTGVIYVDLDVNDIFKNIYLVENRDREYYKIKVVWQDFKE